MMKKLTASVLPMVLLYAQPKVVANADSARPILIAQIDGVAVRCFCGGPVDCPIHRAPSTSSGAGSGSISRGRSRSISSVIESRMQTKDLPLPSPFELQRQTDRKNAIDVNEQGLQMARMANWQEALKLFGQALEKYPDYDDGRKTLRDNIEWAEKELAASTARTEESKLALESVKDFVSRLGDASAADLRDFTSQKQQAPEAPAQPGAKPPRHLPLPGEIEWATASISSIQQSTQMIPAERAALIKEFNALKGEFDSLWKQLDDSYQAYIDAQSEIDDLRLRIEAHNAKEPGEGADLQNYNDEARMMHYQIGKVKVLSEQTRSAFMQNVEKLQPPIDAILKNPVLANLDKPIPGLPGSPELPVLDPRKVARSMANDYGRRSSGQLPSPAPLQASVPLRENLMQLPGAAECPALQGKRGLDRIVALDQMERDWEAAQQRVLTDMRFNLARSQALTTEEIAHRVDRLQSQGWFRDISDLNNKTETSPLVIAILNEVAREIDENRTIREELIRNTYKFQLKNERNRILGYPHEPIPRQAEL